MIINYEIMGKLFPNDKCHCHLSNDKWRGHLTFEKWLYSNMDFYNYTFNVFGPPFCSMVLKFVLLSTCPVKRGTVASFYSAFNTFFMVQFSFICTVLYQTVQVLLLAPQCFQFNIVVSNPLFWIFFLLLSHSVSDYDSDSYPHFHSHSNSHSNYRSCSHLRSRFIRLSLCPFLTFSLPDLHFVLSLNAPEMKTLSFPALQ